MLEPNYKTADEDSLKIADVIPRIVNICCRTEEGFNQMCDWIEKNPSKVSREFLALLAETVRTYPSLNSSGMPYRGDQINKNSNNKLFTKIRFNSNQTIGEQFI